VNHTPARHVSPTKGSASGASSRGATGEPVKGPAHARRLRSGVLAKGLGLGLTAVLVFVGVGVGTAAVTLTGNITQVDAEAALGTDRPEVVAPDDPNAGTALNILLLGSDSRGGENADIVTDGEKGARSDTTMIMHISADRSRVELMSIPRDTLVDVPTCPTSSGDETAPLSNVRFNGAFAQGVMTGGDVESGALCTMKTVESISDVRMDGFVVIDFAGFQKMIDALDGVEMCIPEDVNSKKADNLVLDAGVQTLDGETALKYARARTGDGLGDGSDIGRIARQQELMASLARTVLGQNLLTDSPQLLQFLGAVTGSLTMSSNFASIPGLAGLAYSARGVRPDTIAFMTVPFEYDPADRNRVIFVDETEQVWDNLKHDRPLSDAIAAEEETTEETAGAGDDASTESDGETAETTEEAEEPAASGSPSTEPEPKPTRTREAGEEAFTSADVTSVCG
jgi:LCP family protein required for cell wall assembly